ncbi:MAG: GGDEF domain-containing protein [Acidobacteriota bacterium]|nr:GGDEF domain-containing protein [Acidobacteriota bacterium]
MREYIDPSVLANWVNMLRSDVDGAIWLVDNDDEAQFYELCAHNDARVVPSSGNALNILNILEQRGTAGVVASLRVTQQRPTPKQHNVFVPSLGDVASLLIASGAFDRVVGNLCGRVWMTACRKDIGEFKERAVSLTWHLDKIGSTLIAYGVVVNELSELLSLVDWNELELNSKAAQEYFDALQVPTEALELSRADGGTLNLGQKLSEIQGEDALHIAAHATSHFCPRGIRCDRKVGPASLTAELRLAFQVSEIESDEIFWRMRDWQRLNQRYPLLREWRLLDSLGVLWDQRYWLSDLKAILTQIGPNHTVAVMKMDLDNFKSVNEILGHSAGDDAIRLYCHIVRASLGGKAEVYRRGGDEVVAILPYIDRRGAMEAAESVRRSIERRFRDWARDHDLATPPTASIGLVLGPGGTDTEHLVTEVDLAQKSAKQLGKNRVVCVSAEGASAAV